MPNKLIIPDGYGLFTVRFERDSAIGKFQTFHMGCRFGTTPDVDEMLDQFIASWTAGGSLVEAQPSPVACVNLNLRTVSGGDMFSFDRPNPWTAGGGSPALSSSAVSYTLKLHTVLAGRRFRGRCQLPWAVESEVDEAGVIDGGIVTAYNDAAEVFRLAFASDATKLRGPYVLHSINGLAPTLVTSITLRNTVGTVRRRQRVGTG